MTRKAPAVHRKSFQTKFNQTPQEFHAKYAFSPTAKCTACNCKPHIRAIIMWPLDEAEKRGLIPEGSAKMPLLFPAIAPVLVPIKGSGPNPDFYIRTSMAYSCKQCKKRLFSTLAKAPSWCIVEINEGPDPTNRVQVGLN